MVQKRSFRIPPHTTNTELYRMSHEDKLEIFCENAHDLISGRYPSKPQVGSKRCDQWSDLPPREVFTHWDEKKDPDVQEPLIFHALNQAI